MAPTPTQIAVMPNVIKKIVTSDKIIIQFGTPSIRLLKKTSNSPRKRSGNKFSQNLLQSSVLSDIGEVCKSQNALPSRLTAGNAKRMATALSTNPARAKLTKATTVLKVPAGMGDRSSGRTLKL